MSEPICLTADERAALQEILTMLAVIGERGYRNDNMVCEITYQMWRDQVLKPAQRLMRVAPTRRLVPM